MASHPIPNSNPSGKLRIAYTPDSDDVFNYYAWEHGRIPLPESVSQAEFHRDHIAELNQAAREQRFDVVAVSSVIYPSLAEDYWILAVGNSVGRGWGPVLVSKRFGAIDDLGGKRIAVGGSPTTGSTLARMVCPDAEYVDLTYDEIADAIARDEIDAGVMIHEELLAFREKGLHCVCDLGKRWIDETGLPLPVGLNLVRKALGKETAIEIAGACHRSLRWAFEHPDETFVFANQFGRGQARKHVEMFSNQDTLCLPDDVRSALRVMFDRVAEMGIGPKLESIEIIDPVAVQ